ncbi:MAG TPA: CPBP family intramembrane glutamic endopeptidase [Symbiobacteriaceae bacterium]|nr:CPBP family intramembrane glutamic endopeptidase [Symbiobacteriaceae bacterium]
MQAVAKPRFVERHPVAYFVLLFVAMMFVYILGGAITQIGKLDTTAQILISNPILILLALGIIARQHWWDDMGLTGGQGARPWLLIWLPALFGLSRLLDGIHVTAPGKVAVFLVCSILVGFAEEIYFRGLFMRVLQPYGQKAVIIWCTLLFGVTHSINLLGGQGGLATLIQVVHAAAIGFLLTALRLKGRSLWPLVAVHALIDFLAWISQSEILSSPDEISLSMLILPAIFSVAYTVNGIWLLLRSPKQA